MKCKSLIRKGEKNKEKGHIHVARKTNKNHSNMNNNK